MLIALLLTSTHLFAAHDFVSNGIYYNIISSSNKTVEVTYRGSYYDSYNNDYYGSVVIPEKVTYNNTTYTVTSIGSNAFHDCSGLRSVTIGKSITSIGDAAFKNSGLASVVIGNSVTIIESEAFRGCVNLKDIVIPNSVKEIEILAFYDCKFLSSVTIPNSVVEIGASAFEGCTFMAQATIGKSVTHIGHSAFKDCLNLHYVEFYAENCNEMGLDIEKNVFNGCISLEDILIGKNVTNIPESAFSKCSKLTSITIPNSVTNIGACAFYGCTGLTSVTIGNSVSNIGVSTFYNCNGLTSITIPESVNRINAYAFEGCTSLTSITCDAEVPPTLGNYAFSSTDALLTVPFNSVYAYKSADGWSKFTNYANHKINGIYYKHSSENEIYVTCKDDNYNSYSGDVVIPSTVTVKNKTYDVTSIGTNAFKNCNGLTSTTIPESVNRINAYAFEGCTSLTSITCDAEVPPTLGDYAFSTTDALLTVPFNSVYAYKSADGWSKFTNYANHKINGIYYKHSSENEIYVTYKDDNYNSYSGDIVIPSTVTVKNKTYDVTSIGLGAFIDCNALTSVTILGEVTDIGQLAFFNCKNLNSVNMGNSVVDIGGFAFAYCSNLASITIPNTTTSIGSCAFMDCTNLSSVVFNAENCTTMGRSNEYCVFKGCNNLKNIIIGEQVKTITWHAFYGCSGITSITIPKSVTTIKAEAFNGCTSLKNLRIEDGTETLELGYNFNSSSDYEMGKGLFYDCPLETLYLGRNLSYETGSYYGLSPFSASSLSSVVIGNTVTSLGDYIFSWTLLTNVIIPESITSIGYFAFFSCNLTTLIIPNSVTDIKDGAFQYNENLESLTIGNSVLNIGYDAFENCTSLTSIIIPKSVKNIGDWAFNGCSNLTSIAVESGNTVYDSRDNCNAIINTATNTLEFGCMNTVIPNSITCIGSSAFDSSKGLTSIIIPDAVTNIGSDAFYNCSNLNTVQLGSGLKEIGRSAFNSCYNIKQIVSKNTTSPTMKNLEVFESSVYNNADLIVPTGSKNQYSAAYGWSNFRTISEKNFSGIEETLIDDMSSDVEYYNLNGVKVENPSSGVFIKKQGSKTTKVVL